MSIEISFILPIYNVAPYLSDAIESILRQNILKEIILVGDGSTDNSLEVALQYSKIYPFIYVIHSQNKGVSAARNVGLRMAQGEYILFLDHDDTLNLNVDLKEFYKLGKEYQADIIKGQFDVTFMDIDKPSRYFPPLHSSVNKNNGILFNLETAINNGYFQKNLHMLVAFSLTGNS